MNKKKWIRIVSIYSIIYTGITLLSSILYLCDGIYEDPSGNWHELDRAMILLIGIVLLVNEIKRAKVKTALVKFILTRRN